MAKIQGFIGTGRGKVGNLVLSKGDNGETIARAYQPQVANPRTAAQTSHRSKVNIAGRLSAIVPATAITGLGMGSGRKNRSEFLRNAIRRAVRDTSPEGAHIPAADVVFAKGNIPFSATLGQVSVSRTELSVAYSAANTDGRHGERIIVLVMTPQEQRIGYVMCRMTTTIYLAATGTITIPFDVPLEEGMQVFVYRIPVELDPSASRTMYGTIAGTSNNYVSLDEVNAGVQLVFGASTLISSSAVPAAKKSKNAE